MALKSKLSKLFDGGERHPDPPLHMIDALGSALAGLLVVFP